MRRTLTLLLALALLAVPGPAIAADSGTPTIADMEDEVMCPVCGTTIGLAREAPQAKRERAFIQRMIDAGRTKEEIRDALVVEFGPAVLAEPPDDGFGVSAYAVPVVGGGAVLAVVLFALLRWRRHDEDGEAMPEPTPRLAKNDARKLEAELERLR
jgi:cytochrome c-type biogenesis protein CcmH